MAQKPPLENPGNFFQANELFNFRSYLTLEKCIIPIPQKGTAGPLLVTEKSVSDDNINISEEENTDPQNVDISEEDNDEDSQNNSLPTPPFNKKLKRKSRAVTNQCFTKDEAHCMYNYWPNRLLH